MSFICVYRTAGVSAVALDSVEISAQMKMEELRRPIELEVKKT